MMIIDNVEYKKGGSLEGESPAGFYERSDS